MESFTKQLEPIQRGFHQSVAYLTDTLRFETFSEKLSKLPLLLPEFIRRRAASGVRWHYLRQYSLPLTSKRIIVGVVTVGSAVVGIYVVRRYTRRHYRKSSTLSASGPRGARHHRRKRSGSVNSSVVGGDASNTSSRPASRTSSMAITPQKASTTEGATAGSLSTPRRLIRRGVSGSGIGGGGVGSVIRGSQTTSTGQLRASSFSHSASTQETNTTTTTTSASANTSAATQAAIGTKGYVSGIDFVQSTETSPMPTPRGGFTVTHTAKNITTNSSGLNMSTPSSGTNSPRAGLGTSQVKKDSPNSGDDGSAYNSPPTLSMTKPAEKELATPRPEATSIPRAEAQQLTTANSDEAAASSPSPLSTPRRVATTVVHFLRKASNKIQATDATNELYKQQCIAEKEAKELKGKVVSPPTTTATRSSSAVKVPPINFRQAGSPSEGEEASSESSPKTEVVHKQPILVDAPLAKEQPTELPAASAFRYIGEGGEAKTEKLRNIDTPDEPASKGSGTPDGQDSKAEKAKPAGANTVERRRLIGVASDFLDRMSGESDESESDGSSIRLRIRSIVSAHHPPALPSAKEELQTPISEPRIAAIDDDDEDANGQEISIAAAAVVAATAPASPERATPPRPIEERPDATLDDALSPPGQPTDHTPPPSLSHYGVAPPVDANQEVVVASSPSGASQPKTLSQRLLDASEARRRERVHQAEAVVEAAPNQVGTPRSSTSLADLLKSRRSQADLSPVVALPSIIENAPAAEKGMDAYLSGDADSSKMPSPTEVASESSEEERPNRVVGFFKGRRPTEVFHNDEAITKALEKANTTTSEGQNPANGVVVPITATQPADDGISSLLPSKLSAMLAGRTTNTPQKKMKEDQPCDSPTLGAREEESSSPPLPDFTVTFTTPTVASLNNTISGTPIKDAFATPSTSTSTTLSTPISVGNANVGKSAIAAVMQNRKPATAAVGQPKVDEPASKLELTDTTELLPSEENVAKDGDPAQRDPHLEIKVESSADSADTDASSGSTPIPTELPVPRETPTLPRNVAPSSGQLAVASLLKNRVASNNKESNAVAASSAAAKAQPAEEQNKVRSALSSILHRRNSVTGSAVKGPSDSTAQIPAMRPLRSSAQSAIAALKMQRSQSASSKGEQTVTPQKEIKNEISAVVPAQDVQASADPTPEASDDLLATIADPALQESITNVEYYTDETLWMALGTVALRQKLWLRKQSDARLALQELEAQKREVIAEAAMKLYSPESADSLQAQMQESLRGVKLRSTLKGSIESRRRAEHAARVAADNAAMAAAEEQKRQADIEAAAQRRREEEEAQRRAFEEAERRKAALAEENRLAQLRREEHQATVVRMRMMEEVYNRQTAAAAESQRGTNALINAFTAQMTTSAMHLMSAQQRQEVFHEYELRTADLRSAEATAWVRLQRNIDNAIGAAERKRLEEMQRRQLEGAMQVRAEEDEAHRKRWKATEAAAEEQRRRQALLAAAQAQELEDARAAQLQLAQQELGVARSHLNLVAQATAEAEAAKLRAKEEAEALLAKAAEARALVAVAEREAQEKHRAVSDAVAAAAAEAAVSAVANAQHQWTAALTTQHDMAQNQLERLSSTVATALATQQQQLSQASDVAAAAARAAASAAAAAEASTATQQRQHLEIQTVLFEHQQQQQLQKSTLPTPSSTPAPKEKDDAAPPLPPTNEASHLPRDREAFHLRARIGLIFPQYLPEEWGPIDTYLFDPTLSTIIIEVPQSVFDGPVPLVGVSGAGAALADATTRTGPQLMGAHGGQHQQQQQKQTGPSSSLVSNDLHGSANFGQTLMTGTATSNSCSDNSSAPSVTQIKSRVIVMAHDITSAGAIVGQSVSKTSASAFCRSSIQSMAALEGAALTSFTDGPANGTTKLDSMAADGGIFDWHASVKFNKGERFIEAYFLVYDGIGYAVMLSNTVEAPASSATAAPSPNLNPEVAPAAGQAKRASTTSASTTNEAAATNSSTKGATKSPLAYSQALAQFHTFVRSLSVDQKYFGTPTKCPDVLKGAIRYMLPQNRTITLPLSWRVQTPHNRLPMAISANADEVDGYCGSPTLLTLTSLDTIGKRVQSLEISIDSDAIDVPADLIRRVMRTATASTRTGQSPTDANPDATSPFAEPNLDGRMYEGPRLAFGLPPLTWGLVSNATVTEHRLGYFALTLSLDFQVPNNAAPHQVPRAICHMGVISHPTDHPLISGLLKDLGSPGLVQGSTTEDYRWVVPVPAPSTQHQQPEQTYPLELHCIGSSLRGQGQWLVQYWILSPSAINIIMAMIPFPAPQTGVAQTTEYIAALADAVLNHPNSTARIVMGIVGESASVRDELPDVLKILAGYGGGHKGSIGSKYASAASLPRPSASPSLSRIPTLDNIIHQHEERGQQQSDVRQRQVAHAHGDPIVPPTASIRLTPTSASQLPPVATTNSTNSNPSVAATAAPTAATDAFQRSSSTDAFPSTNNNSTLAASAQPSTNTPKLTAATTATATTTTANGTSNGSKGGSVNNTSGLSAKMASTTHRPATGQSSHVLSHSLPNMSTQRQ